MEYEELEEITEEIPYNSYDDYKPNSDYEESEYSISNNGENKKMDAMDFLKTLDKGFHTIHRLNRNYKKTKIGFYNTNSTPGFYIRNAISGNRYKYKVGSYDEDLFFKVTVATGEIGENHPAILFYLYPEEFEKHMFSNVSEEKKKEWYEKNENRKRFLLKEAKTKKTTDKTIEVH